MIRTTLSRIFQEYPAARREAFKDHPVAQFLRSGAPADIRNVSAAYRQLTWKGSAGNGNWVGGPWIAAFHPAITTTAQRGFYPVYLFSSSLDRVYLSLNQGVTDPKNEFGAREAREILRSRARVLRLRAEGEYAGRFDIAAIDLAAPSKGSLLDFYEHGHAFGCGYAAASLPDENELAADLLEMLRLYSLVASRGGFTVDDDEKGHEGRGVDSGQSRVERRRIRHHKRIERNPKLANDAKRIHGYACQVCGFDFERRYGSLGEEYIEAHHLVPLASYEEDEIPELSPKDDFAVVCANCHRMLHRSNAPAEFGEFVRVYGLRVEGD